VKTIVVALIGALAAYFYAYSLGAATTPKINNYPIPTAKSHPWAITSGSDGALWFIESNVNQIGRIDPTTHAITEYLVPTPNSGVNAGITSGSDGALWFTEGGAVADNAYGANQIGRLDLTTTPPTITGYLVPTSDSAPGGITNGPDGALWFAERDGNKIGRIEPTTYAITEYPVPTANSRPNGITTGPDGALWFAEYDGNNIGRLDLTTTPPTITEYPVPTANSGINSGITTGPDGAIWFTEGSQVLVNGVVTYGATQIGRIDPTTHDITEYPVPTKDSGPSYITSGSDGALWFTEYYANQIGRIDPTTDAVTEYVLGSDTRGITSGPDGDVWFTEYTGDKIGQVVLSAVLKAAPGKINFGNVDATGASKAKKVTVTNTSKSASAVIGTVSPAAPFAIVTDSDHCSGQTLAPKKTCIFELNFQPATVGGFSATLAIPFNGGPEPEISLAGTGLSVALKGPKSETLGTAAAGSIGKAKTSTISNPGSVSVTVDTASLSGPFTIVTDTCATLAPEGKCEISLEFTPPAGATGPQSGQLSLPYTYGSNSGTYRAALSGTAK